MIVRLNVIFFKIISLSILYFIYLNLPTLLSHIGAVQIFIPPPCYAYTLFSTYAYLMLQYLKNSNSMRTLEWYLALMSYWHVKRQYILLFPYIQISAEGNTQISENTSSTLQNSVPPRKPILVDATFKYSYWEIIVLQSL